MGFKNIKIEKPFRERRAFLGDVLFIIMGGDIVKLLSLQYNKVNTVSMMETQKRG
jgi:hypothetical protein